MPASTRLGAPRPLRLRPSSSIVPARAGTIELDGRNLDGLGAPKRVRAGISYVPQEYNVFRNLTVLENLKIAREFMGANGRAARVLDDGLEELFPELPKHYRIAAGNLSGGQRQMLAFACALTARPKLLILDEPSAGLSPILTREVFERVERVNKSGVSILMIEQNAIEALRISQRCIVLSGGRVRASASAKDVLGMKDLNSFYLGNASNHV